MIKNEKNFGYAYAVNRGFQHSNSEIVIITNNDVIYLENSIQNLIKPFINKDEKIGIIGPQQIYPDGKWQYSYGIFPGVKMALIDFFFISYVSNYLKKLNWKFNIINQDLKEVEYIDGAVMAINRKAFEEINGFDEDYFFYTEEADFCYRLKKSGWKILFNPASEVIHERGGSTSKMGLDSKNIQLFLNSKILFCRKHLKPIETKLFIILEKFHHLFLSKILALLSMIFHKEKKFIEEKKLIFENLYRGWRDVNFKRL